MEKNIQYTAKDFNSLKSKLIEFAKIYLRILDILFAIFIKYLTKKTVDLIFSNLITL